MLAPGSADRRPLPAWAGYVERWALPAALLLAFALRVYRLGDKNIWWDEGLAIWAVRQGLLDVTRWTAADVHPPLYFYHLWAWVRLAGEGEFAARLVSAMWGVLTVAVTYSLGRRLGERWVGLLAALLLAVSRFHIWWSQEMRMYVLATLCATTTLYVAVRWLEAERERPSVLWPVLYSLAAASCLYSLYMTGLAPLAANLYAVAAFTRIPRGRRLGAAVRWLAAQAVALALFAPWALYALGRMRTWSVAEPFGLGLLLTLYGTLLSIGISTNVERYVVYLLPFGLTLLGGLLTLLWQQRRAEEGLPGRQAALLLLLAVGLMPIVVYSLTRPRGLFYTPRVEARYLVLFLPAFCTLLGWSAARLGRRLWLLGLVTTVACLGTMLAFLPGYYQDRYLRDETQTMARILGAHTQPGDVVLLISGDRYPLFGYDYERIVPPERRVPVLKLPRSGRFTAENVEAELRAATAGRSRFWVAAVETTIQDPGQLSLAWLDRHYRRAFTHEVGHNALVLYGEQTVPLPVKAVDPQRPLAARGGGLQLLGYDLPGREYRASDAVNLGLYHVASAAVPVEVQWQREDGEVLQRVAQTWTALGPVAGRAAVHFMVWPWYPGGPTRLVVRWPAVEDGQYHSVEIPGPRILAAADRPRAERIAHRLDLTFGDGIRLRGFDPRRALRADAIEARVGEQLTVDLFWEAGETVSQDYTVFVQLLGQAHNPRTGSSLWAQHDGPPVGGQYPTGQWVPGQLVADRHVLTIDPAAPPGDYQLVAGLYLPATLERLRVAGSGHDHVVLTRVLVSR